MYDPYKCIKKRKIISDKRGQVSDTVTWIVATIVIIVIMMFFVFGASLLASTKNVGKYKSSLLSSEEDIGDDIFLKKSLFTYFDTESESSQKKIMANLEDRDSRGEFLFPLIDVQKKVFKRYDLSN